VKKLSDKLTQLHHKNNFKNLSLSFISLILGLMFLNLTGCQMSPLSQTAETKPSYWVFKTNVYSSKKNKNISGYTHVTYMSPKLLRLDIYDPLGFINAGTLVYKDGNFEAVMPFEKKYFFGVASPESMSQILKSPIDPALFVNIIFQKKLNDKNWECNEDAEGYVRDCHNRSAGMDIVWKKNISSADGWVVLTHSEGEVDLKLKNSRIIAPLADEKFKLQIPNSYSKFKVSASGIQKM
jgi:hypothetical protein